MALVAGNFIPVSLVIEAFAHLLLAMGLIAIGIARSSGPGAFLTRTLALAGALAFAAAILPEEGVITGREWIAAQGALLLAFSGLPPAGGEVRVGERRARGLLYVLGVLLLGAGRFPGVGSGRVLLTVFGGGLIAVAVALAAPAGPGRWPRWFLYAGCWTVGLGALGELVAAAG